MHPPAVVVGLDNIIGLQTARILARRSVPVIGIARDAQHPCALTNAASALMTTEHSDSDLLVAALSRLGPRLPAAAVLYPCTDLSVLTISRHRGALSRWYRIPLAEDETLRTLMDKADFARLAEQQGLAVPRTVAVSSPDDAERAADDLVFPCVAKPAVKTTSWEQVVGKKVVRVADPADWRALFAESRGLTHELVLQEWIPGDDSQLYSCNTYFGTDGAPQATFVSRKLRQWPPRSGGSSLAEEIRNDDVLGACLRLFSGIGFTGLGYLEMKYDRRTDRLLMIEANVGRPTGRSAIAEGGGVELLYTMYCDALERPLPAARQQRYIGVKWIYLRRDAQSALWYWRRRELTTRDWWRSWRGRKVFAVWSLRDPRPFLADLIRAAARRATSLRRQTAASQRGDGGRV